MSVYECFVLIFAKDPLTNQGFFELYRNQMLNRTTLWSSLGDKMTSGLFPMNFIEGKWNGTWIFMGRNVPNFSEDADDYIANPMFVVNSMGQVIFGTLEYNGQIRDEIRRSIYESPIVSYDC